MEKLTKKCSKCGLIKCLTKFNKRKNSKDGYRYDCRLCQQNDYNKNKEYYKLKMKENRLSKIDEYRKRDKKYYNENKESILKNKKEYYLDNKDKILYYKEKYYNENKNNKKVYNKIYRINNKEKLNEYSKEYQKKRRLTHPHEFAWRNALKGSIARLGTKKEGTTSDILGYSANDLKIHLELLFTEGMSWDNYGEWHVDHIKRIREFDPKTPLNVVNALSNLQPLWAKDNIKKG